MKITRIHSWKKVLAQLLLLVLPAALAAYGLLQRVNDAMEMAGHREMIWMQAGIFTAGAALALVVYSYRFRFITTAALLLLLEALIYSLTARLVIGEFDTVLAQLQVKVFNILFFAGWLVGYGFARSRYVVIAWCLALLALQMMFVSEADDIRAGILVRAFSPYLVYTVYTIYVAELLRNFNEEERSFGFLVGRRLVGFALVAGLLLWGLFAFFKQDFQGIEQTFGGGQQSDYSKNGSNSERMTEEGKDGSLKNKNQTRLTGSLSKGKRLVFVAKLDNFFGDGQTPNPLYFTSCYYSKFDTAIQAFETDSLMPKNDLFKPDPSKIPLYFNQVDSAALRNTMATLNRKVVSADVYKVLLSPDEFVAPSTAFYCQPIPVEKAFQEQYKSAYRAKMWVSDLNSAYFIYNPAGNPMLEAFQEARFSKLRTVTSFAGLDRKFSDYYTYMPRNEEYTKITELAQRITVNAQTPVDKIIAIRDYFLSKDEYGEPLFRYTDNPGVPGIPSASKLSYFLFENKKGYCAYYAGATLFMLRALGIPSRLAAGFLTVDRNSKNPGWYWFYEDQAHAWVQVYFPGYGWIDFDTTVPDRNTREADQADGTPPTDMQQAWLVAEGNCTKTDTVKRLAEMEVSRLIFHEKMYEVKQTLVLPLDARVAAVTTDTGKTAFSNLRPGMHITAVSFAEALKNIQPGGNETVQALRSRLPALIPTDEIRIMEKIEKPKPPQATGKAAAGRAVWARVLVTGAVVLAVLLLLVLLLPEITWRVLHRKAKQSYPVAAQKAYAVHRAVTYYLHQLKYERVNQSPEQYGRAIDGVFATQLSAFSRVYQKLKYSRQPLTAAEEQTVHTFYPAVIQQVRQHIRWQQRLAMAFNLPGALRFFKTYKRN
jgi:transglutaminase-like putative cysteine protease